MVTDQRSLSLTGVQFSASHNNQMQGADNLRQAIDNNPATRWSTFQTQQPGMWFQVDLGQARPVSQVRLDNDASPQDYPRGYRLQLSLDGQSWTTIAENLANDRPLEVTFAPRRARFMRVEQTGSHPNFWWSIHELELFGPVEGEAQVLTGKGVWALFGNEIGRAIQMAQAIDATHILFKTGGGAEYYESRARAAQQQIKAAGFIPFAWPFIFGDDPAGEAEVALRTWQEGYEGIVFDIEDQAAGKAANIAELGRRLVDQAGLDPQRLYFTSFPNLSAHSTIPFPEMAAFCQGGFMPQSYGSFRWPAGHTLGVMTYQEYENWPADWGQRPAIFPILGAFYDSHGDIRMTPAEFQIWADELAPYRPTFYSIYRAGVTNEDLWPILKVLRPYRRDPAQLLQMLQTEFGLWGEGGIFDDVRETLPDQPDTPWFAPTDLDQTTHYAIHHSATDPRTSTEAIYRSHVERFGGYGYHFTLYCYPTGEGQHWQQLRYTRTVGLKGAHVLGKNDLATVGVCWVGNYEADPPAPETVAVVEDILWRLFTTLDRWLGFKPRVAGHRELLQRGYTACPGGNWAFGPGGVLERLSRR
jgi:hypothetical protein